MSNSVSESHRCKAIFACRASTAAPAIGIVASLDACSDQSVNHLLVRSSHKLTVNANTYICRAPSPVDTHTSFTGDEAVFEDVLCPLFNALLPFRLGEETKTSL